MQKASPSLLILLACLASGPAYAGCSNPAGNEADQFYNKDYHTLQFCNGSQWIAEGAAGGSGGPMLISTQTASSSSSLQFTNLPSTYNTLFLNCAGLLMNSNSTAPQLLVGEGSTPTWETGANYVVTIKSFGGGASGAYGTTMSDLLEASGCSCDYTGSTTIPTSLKAYIDNVGSSSLYKYVTTTLDITLGGSGNYLNIYYSYWAGDTNPLTGIELVASGGGTFTSGTCSLYGMN